LLAALVDQNLRVGPQILEEPVMPAIGASGHGLVLWVLTASGYRRSADWK
jgi:hypothetical protein